LLAEISSGLPINAFAVGEPVSKALVSEGDPL